MMGLRLSEGIDGELFQARTGGRSLADTLDQAALRRLTDDGLVETIGSTLRLRPPGRLLLNGITGALLGG